MGVKGWKREEKRVETALYTFLSLIINTNKFINYFDNWYVQKTLHSYNYGPKFMIKLENLKY